MHINQLVGTNSFIEYCNVHPIFQGSSRHGHLGDQDPVVRCLSKTIARTVIGNKPGTIGNGQVRTERSSREGARDLTCRVGNLENSSLGACAIRTCVSSRTGSSDRHIGIPLHIGKKAPKGTIVIRSEGTGKTTIPNHIACGTGVEPKVVNR